MKGIWCKNTSGCLAGLTLTLVCEAAGMLMLDAEWKVWERRLGVLVRKLCGQLSTEHVECYPVKKTMYCTGSVFGLVYSYWP